MLIHLSNPQCWRVLIPPSFLDTCSLFMWSLGWNALCIVINFLILWSTSLTSPPPVHFKNAPGYFIRGLYRCLCLGLDLSNKAWIREAFFVFIRYYFLIVSFISASLVVIAFNILKYLQFSFSPSDLDFVVLFLYLNLFSHSSLSAWHIFQYQISFQYTDCIFLLFISGYPVLSHFLQIHLCHPYT